MERKIVSGTMLTLLLIGMLTLAFSIQPVKACGTIYIRPDGSVEPSTALIQRVGDVYIFTGSINETIVVEKNSIVIDGNGYMLQGIVENTIGIDLSGRENVTVMNMYILNFLYGIWLAYSHDNTLINNTITVCNYGIRLEHSNCNGIVNNTITDNSEHGICLIESNYNFWFNNKILENFHGIMMLFSTKNTLKSNVMADNEDNFAVFGFRGYPEFYIHDMDTSNIVNGKPLYYWINHRNETIPLDAGCVVVVNSTNITVENLTITNNLAGVLFAFTKNSVIRNVTATNNFYGIDIECSNYNIVINNNASNNRDCGILLTDSYYNLVIDNIATNNTGLGFVGASGGIYLEDTYNNVLINNTLLRNTEGIGVDDSNGIEIIGNDIRNNTLAGIMIAGVSSQCTIKENDLIQNKAGMWMAIRSTLRNKIFHNNFIDNSKQIHVHMPIGWNEWDDSYPSGGNYWSDYNGTDLFSGPYQNETGLDGIADTPYVIYENNVDRYPLMNPWHPTDVSLINVTPSETDVYVGQSINITVNVLNQGTISETFAVICKYELKGVEYIIGSTLVVNLSPNTTTTLIFNLTTTKVATYAIKGEATILPDEVYPDDNNLTSPVLVKVKMVGDINGDNKIDIRDISRAALAFGCYPDHPRWNSQADINQDGKIDIRDLALIAKNFGKTYP